MNTICLCTYAIGWAILAQECRDSCEHEITAAMMIGFVFLWPLGALVSLLEWMLAPLENTIIWSRE